jgi:hypothetical protein
VTKEVVGDVLAVKQQRFEAVFPSVDQKGKRHQTQVRRFFQVQVFEMGADSTNSYLKFKRIFYLAKKLSHKLDDHKI